MGLLSSVGRPLVQRATDVRSPARRRRTPRRRAHGARGGRGNARRSNRPPARVARDPGPSITRGRATTSGLGGNGAKDTRRIRGAGNPPSGPGLLHTRYATSAMWSRDRPHGDEIADVAEGWVATMPRAPQRRALRGPAAPFGTHPEPATDGEVGVLSQAVGSSTVRLRVRFGSTGMPGPIVVEMVTFIR